MNLRSKEGETGEDRVPLNQIITKQAEIIESLTWFDKKLIDLLSQYTEVEEYERKLNSVLSGNDEII